MTRRAIDDATALEAEAQEYPEDRDEIFLEAANAWRSAGRADRAEQLFRQVIEGGGEDRFLARAELADLLLDVGRADEAAAELAAIARDPDLIAHDCGFVAELLAERGDLDGALEWYDRFVARLDPETIEALRGPDGWLLMEATSLRGRRQVREELGLPPDAMDEIVPEAPNDPFARLAASQQPPDRIQVFFYQRAELAEARRRWPDEFPEPDEEYYPRLERQWREYAEQGVASMRLVPAKVEELVAYAERVGESPTEPAVRAQFAGSAPEDRTLPWPPERNARCWCGSGVKYKKCCGRPGG